MQQLSIKRYSPSFILTLADYIPIRSRHLKSLPNSWLLRCWTYDGLFIGHILSMNIDIPAIFTLTTATIYAYFSSQILKSTLSEVHAGGKLLLWTFAVVDGGCQSCLFDGPIIWRELVGMVHLTAIPGLHMYHFASTQGYINMLLCSRCALIII